MKHLVCFGDSITMYGAKPDGWCRHLQQALHDHSATDWLVHGAGVGANTTALALDRIMTDVEPWLPAPVIVEFGINDAYIFTHAKKPRVSLAEYGLNLREIIRFLQAHDGQPILLVNHPMTLSGGHPQGNGQTVEANTLPYNQVVRDLCEELAQPCIDMPARVEAAGIDREDLLAEDGVHLSPEGNRLYGKLVTEALVELGIVEWDAG